MSTQSKDDVLELGETFVTLLKSPVCPPEVRTAIVHYLDQVRQQLDMTNPALVMSVFNFLAESSKSPVTEIITTPRGQSVSSVFAAAAKAGELPKITTPPEPKAMATIAAPTPPITQLMPAVVSPMTDTVVSTGPNLASRLVGDPE